MLLESRDDSNNYKQILRDFRANCEFVGLWEYMTMKVSTLSPRDLAVFVNFADETDDGFETRFEEKVIKVNKDYLESVLKLPNAERGPEVTEEMEEQEAEDYNAFYDSCLQLGVQAANQPDHLK